MVHLFSSTPPFCTLVANQANPACTGHNCYEWLGAWTTLTGGTTTIADSMHTHYSFCCITSCIVNADNIGIGASSICPLYVSGNTKITGSISTCQNYMYFSAGCLDMTGGDKAAVIEYEPEKFAILKVDESPDTIFNDHGTVKILKNDMCCIKFDCVFNKVTEVETDYNLQLTPYNGNHQSLLL